jgi:hypothetical protein
MDTRETITSWFKVHTVAIIKKYALAVEH